MGERFVYTDGVWDLIHPNHIDVMEEALGHGDRLLIGVVSDAMARAYKRQPIMNQADRLRIVSSLRIVSEAVIIEGPLDDGTVVADIMRRFDPVAVCYAGDQYADYYQPAIDKGIFVRLKRRPGVSTTEVIGRVLQMHGIEILMAAEVIDAREIARVKSWLRKVPGFDSELGSLTAEPLPSLTNVAYRIEIRGESYCLRIPGEGTAAFMDRPSELGAIRTGVELGLSPEAVHCDGTGLLLTRFVPNAIAMTRPLFRTLPGAFAEATRILKTIHTSAARFGAVFDVFALIDRYRAIIAAKGVRLPAVCHEVLQRLPAMRAAIAGAAIARVACHCDPICENFIHDGARLWIVDWEYAGMNDPMWDLGDMMVEAGTDAEEEEAILAGYFGRSPGDGERGRAMLYKALSDMLWGLWGFMREADSDAGIDYRAYGLTRIARCAEFMAGAEFPRHLEAVGRDSAWFGERLCSGVRSQ